MQRRVMIVMEYANRLAEVVLFLLQLSRAKLYTVQRHPSKPLPERLQEHLC